MLDTVLNSPFFGLTLSATAWCFGCWAQKKTGFILCNPLLIAVALILAFLALFHIPYTAYAAGGDLIKLMLGPVTAVLALNIYNQRKILKENFLPVLAGCLAGSLTSVVSILALCKAFHVDEALTASLLPKSVTTAIAMGIAESHGGVAGIAAAAVMVAGITGAVFAPLFAKVFHITEPVAEGLAIGACSHALGTTRAMEVGSVQGAMSSIAICVCGILTITAVSRRRLPGCSLASCKYGIPFIHNPFSVLLQGQFTFLLKLPRTNRQLSVSLGILLFLFSAFISLILCFSFSILCFCVLNRQELFAQRTYTVI